MKGKLKKIDGQWYVKGELCDYPVYQHTFDMTKHSPKSIIPLKEGAEVSFIVERFWETGLEKTIEVANLIAAPEKDSDELDDFYYHEVLDRLMILNDMMENYLIDHPVCQKHRDLRDIIESAQDILGEAYLKMGDIQQNKEDNGEGI